MKPPKINLAEEFQMPKNPKVDALLKEINKAFDDYDFKNAETIEWQQPEISIDLRINKTSYLKTPDGVLHILRRNKR